MIGIFASAENYKLFIDTFLWQYKGDRPCLFYCTEGHYYRRGPEPWNYIIHNSIPRDVQFVHCPESQAINAAVFIDIEPPMEFVCDVFYIRAEMLHPLRIKNMINSRATYELDRENDAAFVKFVRSFAKSHIFTLFEPESLKTSILFHNNITWGYTFQEEYLAEYIWTHTHSLIPWSDSELWTQYAAEHELQYALQFANLSSDMILYLYTRYPRERQQIMAYFFKSSFIKEYRQLLLGGDKVPVTLKNYILESKSKYQCALPRLLESLGDSKLRRMLYLSMFTLRNMDLLRFAEEVTNYDERELDAGRLLQYLASLPMDEPLGHRLFAYYPHCSI